MKYLKFLFIPTIALGLTLTGFFGITYNCPGDGPDEVYFGSPFIFKEKSLASSMEYFYCISGLLLNWIIWSGILIIFRFGIIKLSDRVFFKKQFLIFYKIIAVVFFVFSTFIIFIEYQFNKINFNEAYWSIDPKEKKEHEFRGKCKGEWGFFNAF